MGRTLLIVGAGVLIAGAIGIGLARRLMPAGPADGPPPIASGHGVKVQFSDKPVPLPAFDLKGLEGETVSPEAWRGKVVLVNFWATWCGPCREEIPALAALQDRYRDYVVVVGLSIDVRPAEDVRAFGRQAGINYPVAIAGTDVQAAFGGIPAVPTTFVVDPAGGIVQRHVGLIDPVLTEHEVRALSRLPTDATVTTVRDTGQVLLTNAAFATELPGVDLTGLTPGQKEAALTRLNTEKCDCGCGLTVAQCRINDPTCTVSPPIAARIVADVRAGR